MRCDSKTMLKTAGLLAFALAVVYFTVPAAHAFVLASAPLLVVLICPVSMLLMMKFMNGHPQEDDPTAEAPRSSPSIAAAAPDAGMTTALTPRRRAADVADRRGVRG